MKKKQSAVFGVAFFCVLALVLAAVRQMNRPDTDEGTKHISVEVVHGGGNTANFEYDTDREYLGEVLQENGLISGSESEYGLFVDTVDGETADFDNGGAWWRLTCNGTDAENGADSVALHDGDDFCWIYTVS